jgi:membrane-bound serine protease (ClpP class)
VKRFNLFLLGVFGLSVFLRPAVLKIQVNAPIHAVTSEYIRKAIARADRESAGLLIMKLNTPGGLDTAMREIIEAILASRTPVAAYVAPSGSRAASAGFFIGVASDLFIMAPGTNTGAAHPVGISITGQGLDKTMEDKVTHDAASYIKSLAERRGRNVRMAEDAVRQSLSYTEKEAAEQGLIDLVAVSDQDILDHFDGRTVRRIDGREEVLKLAGEPVIDVPMSKRQKFLLAIAEPNLAYILLIIGLLGLYFEFSHPGAILPGVLGGICLLLAVFSFQILPVNYVGLLLILLAVGLFILEVKVVSHGLLSIGGVAAMVFGSIMLIDSPIPELKPSLEFIIPVAVGFSLIALFLVTLVFRAHRRKVVTGKEGLIGETGVAQTDLAPGGKVFVHGEIWDAEAPEPVSKGSRVTVIGIGDHLKIKVKKA